MTLLVRFQLLFLFVLLLLVHQSSDCVCNRSTGSAVALQVCGVRVFVSEMVVVIGYPQTH